MGEPNKRHNRKIWRACPVCKGRVVLAHRNQNWWVSCEYDRSHIPQRFFPHPHEAIEAWNVKGNKMTNADRIRAMTDEELSELLYAYKCVDCILFSRDCKVEETLGSGKTCDERILDWLKQEAE